MDSLSDERRILQYLRERFRRASERIVFHEPPDDPKFTPWRASAAELAKYRFPEEPDRPAQPGLHRLWQEFLAPPEDGIFTGVQGALAPFGAVVVSPRRASAAPRLRKESSGNWSGAYAKPARGASFRRVFGHWTVPKVSPPGNAAPNTSYVSSTWIGLDGQRQYRHSSLPQVGSEQIAGQRPPGRLRDYNLWVQWWERDDLGLPMVLTHPLKDGDAVRTILTVLSPTLVRFHLRVNDVFIAAIDLPAPSSAETPPVEYRVSGATAEWIMERPSPLVAPGIPGPPYELPVFGEADLFGCVAEAVDPFGRQSEFDLNPGHLITMKGALAAPRRRRRLVTATSHAAQAPGGAGRLRGGALTRSHAQAKPGSTGTRSASARRFVSAAMPTTASSSPYCASVIPLGAGGAVWLAMQ
jgi:hypothetical protein